MAKKKKEENVVKKEIQEIPRLGKCLKCNKPMVRNHLTCLSCRRKVRLMKKANRRGKPKRHYLN